MNANYFTETLLPLFTVLQPFFRERGLDEDNCDFIPVDKGRWDGHTLTPRTMPDYDWSEEAQRRSLWGMVDWNRFLVCPSFRNGDIWIKERERAWEVFATPTEAILQALCAQEGVET